MSHDYPILYSFRRCPYAMRARMALWISGSAVEIREIALKAKPLEMVAASPKATVPVLVLPDGRVIDESLDIMQWALGQNDPESWLIPLKQGNEAHRLIQENDSEFKKHLDHYKYQDRFSDLHPGEARNSGQKFLQSLEVNLSRNPFLCSSQISMPDIALLPFVRQFASVDRVWFDTLPLPKLKTWLELLIESEMFKCALIKYDVWQPSSCRHIFKRFV